MADHNEDLPSGRVLRSQGGNVHPFVDDVTALERRQRSVSALLRQQTDPLRDEEDAVVEGAGEADHLAGLPSQEDTAVPVRQADVSPANQATDSPVMGVVQTRHEGEAEGAAVTPDPLQPGPSSRAGDQPEFRIQSPPFGHQPSSPSTLYGTPFNDTPAATPAVRAAGAEAQQAEIQHLKEALAAERHAREEGNADMQGKLTRILDMLALQFAPVTVPTQPPPVQAPQQLKPVQAEGAHVSPPIPSTSPIPTQPDLPSTSSITPPATIISPTPLSFPSFQPIIQPPLVTLPTQPRTSLFNEPAGYALQAHLTQRHLSPRSLTAPSAYVSVPPPVPPPPDPVQSLSHAGPVGDQSAPILKWNKRQPDALFKNIITLAGFQFDGQQGSQYYKFDSAILLCIRQRQS